MTDFRCIAIPTETAERFRRTGIDDRGNQIRRMTATNATGFPCRHCLRPASPGEEMLLGAYDLPRPRGVYWTPSPIFVHAQDCPRFVAGNVVAPILAGNSLVSVRAYDAEDLCLYDLGQVCDGGEIEAPLLRALNDARTAFVSVHTARPGCVLAQVVRSD